MKSERGSCMKRELILPPGLNLRLANEGDERFLFTLFCSARPELALLPLPPSQLEPLIRQQYQLQQRGYAQRFPQAEHWIIETPAGTAGKIMFEQSATGIHIIDFVIAPEWRGRGLGGSILAVLKNYVVLMNNEAGGDYLLSLSVDRQNNNAKRLYLRCGFVVGQTSDTHESMVWASSQEC